MAKSAFGAWANIPRRGSFGGNAGRWLGISGRAWPLRLILPSDDPSKGSEDRDIEKVRKEGETEMATRTMEPPAVDATGKDSISAYGTARSTVQGTPLNAEALRKTHAYWRACNYLSLGMIYLQENPLLREPLRPEHVKNRLLGHW